MKKLIILLAFLVLALALYAQQTVRIIAAARPIPAGAVIGKTHLIVKEMPKNSIPAGAVIYENEISFKTLEGLVPVKEINRGSVILPSDLRPANIAERTPAQWRAYIFETDAVTASSVKAGDVADVLFSFEALLKEKNAKEQVVATILQRIKVLDVINPKEGGHALVLTLDPRDAQYLFLAEKEGKIKLIFRNASDSALNAMPVASYSALFQGAQ